MEKDRIGLNDAKNVLNQIEENYKNYLNEISLLLDPFLDVDYNNTVMEELVEELKNIKKEINDVKKLIEDNKNELK